MYVVRDRECGNKIEEVRSVEEGERLIEKYEAEDTKDGTYTEDFYEVVEKMNGEDLIRNLIDELIRAREIVEEKFDRNGTSYLEDLICDIDVDLARFYDYEDSIIECCKDIEIEY